MKTRWTVVKTILLLGALPLVATAAASAHQWLSDTSPISVGDVITTPSDQISSERVHTVALNRAGAIEGRIASIDSETRESSGLSQLKIYFVQNGKIANETITSDDGTFIVDGIAEGAYSFIATGKTGFAAYGVHVVSYNGTEQVNTMEAAAVSPNFSAVRQILQDKLPVEVAEEILSSSDLVSEQVVGANRVRLQNGSLKGHVIPIVGKVESVQGTYVYIIKDDQTIAEVLADESGQFSVPDLEPGVYAFVAAGEQGFAAVSFEAIAQEEEVGSISDLIDTEEVPVGLPGFAVEPQDALTADIPADAGVSVSDTMDVSLTGAQDSAFVGDQLNVAGGQYYDDITYSAGYGEIEYAGVANDIGYGCAAGGSCGACGDYSGYSACCTPAGGGAGGGFAGGGRFARIAGLAALGIAIAALATSGSDSFGGGGGGGGFPPPPPPQSPFVPPNPGNNYGNYYDGYYGGGYDNYYYGSGGYNNNSYGGHNNNSYGGYNNNSYGGHNNNSGGYGSSFYN